MMLGCILPGLAEHRLRSRKSQLCYMACGYLLCYQCNLDTAKPLGSRISPSLTSPIGVSRKAHPKAMIMLPLNSTSTWEHMRPLAVMPSQDGWAMEVSVPNL